MTLALPWSDDPNYTSRTDYRLVNSSFVRLVHDRSRMERYSEGLEALGYDVTVMPGISEQAFRDEVTRVFDFPGQFSYGPWNGQYDALNDGFGGLSVPASNGRALVVDRFAWSDAPKMMWGFCDLFATRARDYLLRGKVLILLLQSDDPRFQTNKPGFHLEDVGGTRLDWVDEEWAHAARGL